MISLGVVMGDSEGDCGESGKSSVGYFWIVVGAGLIGLVSRVCRVIFWCFHPPLFETGMVFGDALIETGMVFGNVLYCLWCVYSCFPPPFFETGMVFGDALYYL